VETLKIAHTTQFVMMFNVEKAVVAEVRAETGVFDFAKIEAKLQGTVRQQHNIQATSTLSIERTSQQTIPPQTHVRITLYWKRIWQDGVIILRTVDGVRVSLPYSFTMQLDFSKKVEDIL
jgi:hypothetical protein